MNSNNFVKCELLETVTGGGELCYDRASVLIVQDENPPQILEYVLRTTSVRLARMKHLWG